MRSVLVLLAIGGLLAANLARAEDECTQNCDDESGGSQDSAGTGENADTTTAATGAGEGEGGGSCNSFTTEDDCAGDCVWDAVGESCADVNCGDLDEDTCEATDGCKSTVAGCEEDQGDGAGGAGDDSTTGQCQLYDNWMARCQAHEAEGDCDGDGGCMWERGTCGKDIDYDPNDCGQYKNAKQCDELGQPGAADVIMPGCEWSNSTEPHVCAKREEDEQTEDRCKDFDKKAACNDATSENEAGEDERLCEWEVLEGGDGVGDTVQCNEFEKKEECNSAKTDTNHKACDWDEDAGAGGEGGGTGAGAGEASNCQFYDVCPTLESEDACEERQDSCRWNKDTCQSNSMEGAVSGCSGIEEKTECEEMTQDDAGPGGGDGAEIADDDADKNPMCLFLTFTANSCTIDNDCQDIEAKNTCSSNDDCEWNVDFESCASKVDETMCDSSSKSNCEDAGCNWEGNKQQNVCIDFRACAYMSEDACEGAKEKCYWEGGFDNNCYEGDRPTSSTTVTTLTTLTLTTTVTTIFSCARADERMCTDGFAVGQAAGRFGDKKCIKKAFFCDGQQDCGDNSDESGCDFTTPPPKGPKECPQRSTLCDNGKVCFQNSWECDGMDDCGDGSDEKDCATTKKPEKKTTTETTTTETTMTTFTTKTTTVTTTTESPCITTGDCDSGFEYQDAVKDTPLFTTSMICRKCASPGMTQDQLCAQAFTSGCVASEVDLAKLVGDKLSAFANTNLRIKVPAGVNPLDVAAAIKQQLPEIDLAIRASSIVAVDVEDADEDTGYRKVIVYTSKSSGASALIAGLPAENEIQIGDVRLELFNAQKALSQDKEGNALPSFAVDDDFAFEANDDLFRGMTAEEVEEEYEKLMAGLDMSDIINNGGSDESSSGGGAVAGAVIGGLVFIGLAIFGVYFMYERKRNGERAGGRPTTKTTYQENPVGGGAAPSNSARYDPGSRTLHLADSGDGGGC